jgi:hypothetical protein
MTSKKDQKTGAMLGLLVIKLWSLPSIAAMLQFVALVTIFVMMRTAKRQLRAYVFAE